MRTPKVCEVIPWASCEALINAAGITLYDYQRRYLNERWPQIKQVSGGVGASKTFMTALEDLIEVTLCGVIRKANSQVTPDGITGRLAIVGKSYRPTHVVFKYLHAWLQQLGALDGRASMLPDRQWSMKTTAGVEIVTVSSQDPNAFASVPYSRVHITEAMQVPEAMLNFAMERVSRWPRSPVGSICLEGTFEDDDTQEWYIDIAEQLSTAGHASGRFYCIESWLNEETYPGGYMGEKCQALLRWYQARNQEHEFLVRYGGRIPARKGALWHGYFDTTRHLGSFDEESRRYFPDWNPAIDVQFAFDPGLHRYAGLFIQQPHPNVVHVFDELVMRNRSASDYRKAWRESPYVLYRDGEAAPYNISHVVSDIAGKHHQQGNQSTWEHWATSALQGGCGVIPRGEYLSIDTGVTILQHGFSGETYTIKISPRCVELLSDLRKERRNEKNEVDEKLNRGNDDCRKALSYYLRDRYGLGIAMRQAVPSNACIGTGGQDYLPVYNGASLPAARKYTGALV